jgi:DNA-binding response OmpR family regulator
VTPAIVVDDDRHVATLVARWLSKGGYVVETYNAFEEAKQRIQADRPGVLVVDVRLEGFNGLHLAILARHLNPDARIVVLSAFDDPALRREAATCGAMYLLKPLKAEELLAALEPEAGETAQT